MGFGKWILKNGFGGVGWMTKLWMKVYKNKYKHIVLNDEIKLGLFVIEFQKVQSNSNNVIDITDSVFLVNYSEKCIATLFFCMMCDTKDFVKEVNKFNDILIDTLKVIYEICIDINPDLVKQDFEKYQYKCIMYLRMYY